MPAYKRKLSQICQTCSSNAPYEVFNRFNANCGYYCNRHAKMEIKRLDQLAKEQYKLAKERQDGTNNPTN